MEISVGIRIDPEEGISSFGIEKVNSLINFGSKVISMEQGGAVMRRLPGKNEETVSMTLSGCDMKVIMEDIDLENSPQWQEYCRRYKEGSALIKPYMHYDDVKSTPATESNGEIERGIELLKSSIEINEGGGSAYWLIGKAYQALKNDAEALAAFKRAFELERENKDVAREYCLACLDAGEPKRALMAAGRAVTIAPDDAGLRSNLGLAYLLDAQLDHAEGVLVTATEMDPNDSIAKNLLRLVGQVKTGERAQPKCIADLQKREG